MKESKDFDLFRPRNYPGFSRKKKEENTWKRIHD
jgi:hypothetical protein